MCLVIAAIHEKSFSNVRTVESFISIKNKTLCESRRAYNKNHLIMMTTP